MTLNLPEDPETASIPEDKELTLENAIKKYFDKSVADLAAEGQQAGVTAEKYVSNDPKAPAPSISISADGVPHVTLALTKSTKAHVAAVASGLTGAASLALSFEPADFGWLKLITGGAIVVGGAVLSWLGVHSATNLPKKV